jgi:hypothetical protein
MAPFKSICITALTTLLIEAPPRRRAASFAIFRGSCSVRGRPPTRPWALARCSPAIVLSLNRTLSCFATAARIPITAYGKEPLDGRAWSEGWQCQHASEAHGRARQRDKGLKTAERDDCLIAIPERVHEILGRVTSYRHAGPGSHAHSVGRRPPEVW